MTDLIALINAAPDLLAAAVRAEGVFDEIADDGYLNDRRREVWKQLREVIAKANGQTP